MLTHNTLECVKARLNPKSHWLLNGSFLLTESFCKKYLFSVTSLWCTLVNLFVVLRPTHILMHPRVHRAHRLKSAVLVYYIFFCLQFIPIEMERPISFTFFRYMHMTMLIVFVISHFGQSTCKKSEKTFWKFDADCMSMAMGLYERTIKHTLILWIVGCWLWKHQIKQSVLQTKSCCFCVVV